MEGFQGDEEVGVLRNPHRILGSHTRESNGYGKYSMSTRKSSDDPDEDPSGNV